MNSLSVLALFCALAVSYGVVTFNAYNGAEKDAYDIMNILMRPRTPERYLPMSYFQKHGINPENRLTAFSVKNCGDPSTETAKLVDLEISPDPIVIPGNVDVSFGLDVSEEVASPLQADVVVKTKVFGAWITLPCLDNFGSCNYADFCEILDLLPECPQPFIDNDVPCKCPFDKGDYTLPNTEFEVNMALPIPAGDYSGQVNLTMNGSPVACYEVELTLAN